VSVACVGNARPVCVASEGCPASGHRTAASRLNTGMLAAAHGSGSGAFLTSQAVSLIALAVAIAGFTVQIVTSDLRRRITYGMPVSARLIDRHVAPQNLRVLYRDQKLDDPYVLEIDLAYRGFKDIPKSSFEGEPLCIDVGARIIDLLNKISHPEVRVPAEAVGTELRVGPVVLRKGQAMTFVVLTDGPGALRMTGNPLAGVKVRQEAQARHQTRAFSLKKIAGWAVVIFIAFYLFTEPTTAAGAMRGLFHLLNQAASSLATFLTWL
jgi:hypothetical protein